MTSTESHDVKATLSGRALYLEIVALFRVGFRSVAAMQATAGRTRAASGHWGTLGLIVLLAASLGCRAAPSGRRVTLAYPRGLQSLNLYDPGHEQFSSAILANAYEGLVEMEPD